MRRLTWIKLAVLILAGVAVGQSDRTWTNMSVEQALKVLNASPWVQTQTDTDTSEMFYSPTKPGTSSIESGMSRPNTREQSSRNNNRTDRGALNEAVSINYHVRFFSARPIREALARLVFRDARQPLSGGIDEWQQFVERDMGPYIVLTVTYDSTDGRFLGPAIQAFSSATMLTLKNNTYLERSDGKRIYLLDYRAPSEDGLGAKFVFPRLLAKSETFMQTRGYVRFVSDVGPSVKLNVKFNLANMIFDDRLQY